MPQKKQPSLKKRTSKKLKKTSPSHADTLLESALLDTTQKQQENIVCLTVPDQPVLIEKHHTHLVQAVILSAGFMVLFTSFLFVSTKMKAQENAASVSAVVLPNEFNTRPPKQPSWWEKIDPYTKLYAGTGVVGAVVVGLGALVLLPKKRGGTGSV